MRSNEQSLDETPILVKTISFLPKNFPFHHENLCDNIDGRVIKR